MAGVGGVHQPQRVGQPARPGVPVRAGSALSRRAWVRVFAILWLAGRSLVVCGLNVSEGPVPQTPQSALEQRFEAAAAALAPVEDLDAGLSHEAQLLQVALSCNHRQLLREKIDGRWFAAMVSLAPEAAGAVVERFVTWKSLIDFLLEQQAVVEVWTYGAGPAGSGRRLTALEVGAMKRAARESPTWIKVVWRDTTTGRTMSGRLEFGFGAAEVALASNAAYARHRELLLAAQDILGARNERGRLDASEQLKKLQRFEAEGRLLVTEPIPAGNSTGDLLVAFEFRVDDQGCFTGVQAAYRESQLRPEILPGPGDRNREILVRRAPGLPARRIEAYRRVDDTGALELVATPIAGRDAIELRVINPEEPDPARWNRVEFGAGELLHQSALATFGLIGAHLDRQRKSLLIQQANMALIVEPIFTGLNIAGTLSFGFPAGAAARLAYNLTFGWQFIPKVPKPAELRRLFTLLAARDRIPGIRGKPNDLLDKSDVAQLEAAMAGLTESDVAAYVDSMSNEDLAAMVRIARMARMDESVTLFLSIVADAALVSGAPSYTLLQEIFNNPYFSVTGEINLTEILAAATGTQNDGQTPLGPWTDMFGVGLDLRAVVNTVAELRAKSLAQKELDRPFPYAPRMDDLAAYEIRVFGFPLLLFYKRGLIRQDYEAFVTDYAYGILGTHIVEHFASRAELEAEIQSGRMFPLGYVRVRNLRGVWQDTNLAVFAHRLASGKHRGEVALVIYGMRAYAEKSASLERECARFRQWERALTEGGVIEQVVAVENGPQLASPAGEPQLFVGEAAVSTHYDALLGRLLELQRLSRLRAWGIELSPAELEQGNRLTVELSSMGVETPTNSTEADFRADVRSSAWFRYRTRGPDGWQTKRLVLIPGLAAVDRERRKAEEGARIEAARRRGVSPGGSGVVLLNECLDGPGGLEIGPLLVGDPTAPSVPGEVMGQGLREGPDAVRDFLSQLNQKSVLEQARFEDNGYAATPIEWELAPGRRERVIATLEFPLEYTAVVGQNPGGVEEHRVYSEGRLTRVVTDGWVIDVERDPAGVERERRIFVNQGTLAAPQCGPLLQRSRVTRRWQRRCPETLEQAHQPRVERLTLSLATGGLSLDTFGLFPLPVSMVDNEWITEQRYDELGRLYEGHVWRHDANVEPASAAAWRNPRHGIERFLSQGGPDHAPPSQVAGPPPATQHWTLRTDLLKRSRRWLLLDDAQFGRVNREIAEEILPDGTVRHLVLEHRFDPAFAFGFIPQQTVKHLAGSTLNLVTLDSTDYDAERRVFTAVETDDTGRRTRKTWDSRWESPTVIQSAARRTTFVHDQNELRVEGRVVSLGEDEEVARFTGAYDAEQRVWRVRRDTWYGPGILRRSEEETLTSEGTLLFTRLGAMLELRPERSPDGQLVAMETWLQPEPDHPTSLRIRRADHFTWNQGNGRAQVQEGSDEASRDAYEIELDAEGRVVVDGIRHYPNLDYESRVAFVGGTERLRRAEVVQNGQLRERWDYEAPQLDASGHWQLRVKVTPAWGDPFVRSGDVADPYGRLRDTHCANGDWFRVMAWRRGTASPATANRYDHHGQWIEQSTFSLAASSVDGIPLEERRRFRVAPWGAMGLVVTETLVRGTPVLYTSAIAAETIVHDWRTPYDSPRYAIAPDAAAGCWMDLGRAGRKRVTALFTSSLGSWTARGGAARTNEPALLIQRLDLSGVYVQRANRRWQDAAGNVLMEQSGATHLPPGPSLDAGRCLDILTHAPMTESRTYFYEPGWFNVLVDRAYGGPVQVFYPARGPVSSGLPANEEGRRDRVTRIDFKQATDNPEADWRLFRRLDAPRLHSHLPTRPDDEGLWLTWAATTFDPDRKVQFDSVWSQAADGTPSVIQDHKLTRLGGVGVRTTHHLQPPAQDDWQHLTADEASWRADVLKAGGLDLTDCDFVYCFATGAPGLALRFTDARGRSAQVASEPKTGALPSWLPGPAHIAWSPDIARPDRAVVVTAQPHWLRGGQPLVVPTDALAAAGLDISRIETVQAELFEAPGSDAAVSRLGRVVADIRPRHRIELEQDPWQLSVHPSGLRTSGALPPLLPWKEARHRSTGPEATLDHADLTAGVLVRDENKDLGWVLTGTSVLGLPSPIDRITAFDGRLTDLLRSHTTTETLVFQRNLGFRPARVSLFRAEVLDDEAGPAWIAYGDAKGVASAVARGGNPITHNMATLYNRVSANVFRAAANNLFGAPPVERDTLAGLANFNAVFPPGDAPLAALLQAQVSLAASILPRVEPPWTTTNSPEALAPVALSSHALDALHELAVASGNSFPATRLLPTAPGSEGERFVDTAREGDWIRLALKLGDPALARDLLGFYWRQSGGGAEALHACYDAQSGSSRDGDPRAVRPMHAWKTADAQLSIAQAAFDLWGTHGDPYAFALGSNLLAGVLRNYRFDDASPAGITELPVLMPKRFGPLILEPDPPRHPIRSNARAYLLVRQLTEAAPIVRPWFSQEDWNVLVGTRADLERWFTSLVIPEVRRTGVVPAAFFPLPGGTNRPATLAPEPTTSAEDWLWFIEATAALNLEPDMAREWLDNLARVHGQTVAGIWGLDWSLAPNRPPMVSSQLTAHFARVAELVEYPAAVRFASAQVQRMHQPNGWPEVQTRASPDRPWPTGQGAWVLPAASRRQWCQSVLPLVQILPAPSWQAAQIVPSPTRPRMPTEGVKERDTEFFLILLGAAYGSILLVTLAWWTLRTLRRRHSPQTHATDTSLSLVPPDVMRQAEERWARRVLGMMTAPGTRHTRFSNAPVEANFHAQLRAIYKLVLEWRRRVHGRFPGDPSLVEGTDDAWMNGADEFATLVGLYMRYVIKAGRKDGRPTYDIYSGNEDSNHIWARLLIYFSEYLFSLRNLLDQRRQAADDHARNQADADISLLLNAMGLRPREAGFDARALFDAPANPQAFDLLLLQKPGLQLRELFEAMALRLGIPSSHSASFLEKFHHFKRTELQDPVHPYIIETARLLPHFILMGLGALVAFNATAVGDPSLLQYALEQFLSPAGFGRDFRTAAALTIVGFCFSGLARLVRIYRWDAAMRRVVVSDLPIERTLTGMFNTATVALPLIRRGWFWKPGPYEVTAWSLRIIGLIWMTTLLLGLETPSFATFMLLKGLLAGWMVLEVASLALPLAARWLSHRIQELATDPRRSRGWIRALNHLNLPATRPTSVAYQSARYHFQPSSPSGTNLGLAQTVAFYFLLNGAFFVIGVFLCQSVFPLWVAEQYRNAANIRLIVGSVFFWATMYLLRYGLFVAFSGVAAWFATFPGRSLVGLVSLGVLIAELIAPSETRLSSISTSGVWIAGGIGLALLFLEEHVARWWRPRKQQPFIPPAVPLQASSPTDQDPNRSVSHAGTLPSAPGAPTVPGITPATPTPSKLAVIYMSGDDLSYRKLTPELLMERWFALRHRLDSTGSHFLWSMAGQPDDATLGQRFGQLYELERASDMTLWHPDQLRLAGDPSLPGWEGLTLQVAHDAERRQLLATWHLRRWLVSMMSTAGHSQDTGITLVDLALHIARDGLGPRAVFYLIQNKYDDREDNRPSQVPADRGELGQREKLARLIELLAPGAQAFSLHNWTPFGFKAGALTGTDLVPEVALDLGTMVMLDRNATVHDLDAVMDDIHRALNDPDLVVIVPGRGTTNTLTPMGQASQLVEEGHRSFLHGLMRILGGSSGESLGTGWGNIAAVHHGLVQRALLNPLTRLLPLTSRLRRRAALADRLEGLVGFCPHAVGISEDIWAVVQSAHNAVALGRRVKFQISTAMWHKIRETWSHAEWLSSFPRWSGGSLQMMQDPVMQQIHDFGPLSVFAKDLRAGAARFYTGAIPTLLNVLLIPIAILLDVTPFVQILIVLWNFGFIMNQVLTLHGLHAYVESAGFHNWTAGAGAIAAAGTSWFVHADPLIAAAATLLGTFLGGFAAGLGRWLRSRLRDLLLFGPQLVLHAMGQLFRQSLEFTVSGAAPNDARQVNMAFRSLAGPREDRPMDPYPGPINLRTVTWVVGFGSLALNLCALMRLDLMNLLMLLPSLLFSISTLAGPFVLRTSPGTALGPWTRLPRLLGWSAAALFFLAVSWCFARGLTGTLVAAGAVFAVLGAFARVGLRHASHRQRVRRFQQELNALAQAGGVQPAEAGTLASRLLANPAETAARPWLDRTTMTPAAREQLLALLQAGVRPYFASLLGSSTASPTRRSRFASDFRRVFAVAWLILLCFWIVPVPPLFMVKAGDYSIVHGLGSVLFLGGGSILLALAGGWIADLTIRIDRRGLGRKGLEARAGAAFEDFLANCARRAYNPADTARGLALFTDFQTYLDQGATAHARRTLNQIQVGLSAR